MLSRRNFLCRIPLVAGARAGRPGDRGRAPRRAHGSARPHRGGRARWTRRRTGSTRTRSCATSTRASCAAACASGSWSRRRRRSRSRPASSTPPGRTTAACRGRRCARARASGCASGSSTPPDHPHTIHFHGIHTARMDGVPGVGAGNIEPGQETVYEFDAEPFGLHLYHCHSIPLADHIAKGLYGAFVIDPKQGRPKADELVMVMNGFDTNFDRSNEVYAVNTVAFAYQQQPIRVKRGRAGPDLPRQRARVRPHQLVPRPRELLPLLPDRHVARADRADRHGHPGPGPARDPRAALPVRGQVHVPRARVRVRRTRLDGLLRGRVMEATTATRARARLARRARRRSSCSAR